MPKAVNHARNGQLQHGQARHGQAGAFRGCPAQVLQPQFLNPILRALRANSFVTEAA